MKGLHRVRSYWNVHKNLYSIVCAKTGRLIQDRPHREYLQILFPKFTVQPAGRQRVLDTGRKNVHAFVIGELIPEQGPYSTYLIDSEEMNDAEIIRYNPITNEAFCTFHDGYRGREVFEADKICMDIKGGRPRMQAIRCVPDKHPLLKALEASNPNFRLNASGDLS